MKRLLQFSLLITSIIAIIISCAKEEPEVKKFNLTVIASEGGSVSTQGGVYVEGEIARVTATPSDGYVFSGWSNGSSDNPIQITMNSNTSITANFTKVKYAIDITVDGQGSVTEEVVSSGKEYDSGSVVKLTAVPSEGWLFSHWSGASNVIENTVELTADSNKSITAHFIEIPFEAISVGDGTIATELVYNDSNEVTAFKLTATTPVGWRFDGWTGGVQSSEMIIEVATDLVENITATFIQVYDLTLNIVGEGEVTDEIITDTSKTFDAGTNVKLTAEPASGWRFDKWTGSVESNESVIVVNVDDAKEITATFIQVYDLTVTVEGEGIVTEEIVTTTDKTTSYDTGVTVKLTAEPAEGWRFDKWTGAIESTETVVQVEMNQAKEVTATFVKIYDLTVTTIGEGTVTEEIVTTTDKTTSYDTGVTVKLTAEPAEGWEFKQWEGSIEGSDPTKEIVVSKRDTILARFRKPYNLNIEVVGEGTYSTRLMWQNPDTGFEKWLIEAIPNSGWDVKGWSDNVELGGEGSDNRLNPVAIELNEDKNVTLTFEVAKHEFLITTEGQGYIEERVIEGNEKLDGKYENNTYLRLIPHPAKGWRFRGDLSKVTNNENVEYYGIGDLRKVEYDTYINAVFEKVTKDLNYNEYEIEFDKNLYNNTEVGSLLAGNGRFGYSRDGSDYIFFSGSGDFEVINGETFYPERGYPILLKRIDDLWKIYKTYPTVEFEHVRNYSFLNDDIFAIGDSSENIPNDDPNQVIGRVGDLYVGEIINDDILWKKVNDSQSQQYFHNLSLGDLNNDGLYDILGGGFAFLQTNNHNFSYKYIDDYDISTQQSLDGILEFVEGRGGGTSGIGDLDNDGINEIVFSSFDSPEEITSKTNGLYVYKFNSLTQKYILEWQSDDPFKLYDGENGGVYTEIKDFNGDGLNDIAMSKEGYVYKEGERLGKIIEIWINEGDLSFRRDGAYLNNGNEFRTFDIDKDGDLDIVIHGNNGANTWNPSGGDSGTGAWESYSLKELILLNDGSGKFSYPTMDLLFNANGSVVPYMYTPLINSKGNLEFVCWEGLYVEDFENQRMKVITIELPNIY